MTEFLSVLCLFLTAAGFFPRLWWGFAPVGFFRLQYAVIAFICLFFSFWSGAVPLIFINGLTIAINIMILQGWLPKQQKPHGEKLDIASINIWKENRHVSRLKQYIESVQPDILLLMEVTEDFKTRHADILNLYPHSISHYVRDGFEIWLLSRFEMQDTDIREIGCKNTPLLSCRVRLNGRDIRIFSAHPRPAINAGYFRGRQSYFQEFAEILRRETLPVIALGDFNSVPWEEHFQNFLTETGLQSTLQSCGYRVTWPRYFPPFGIPMDHILISREIDIDGVKVGPNVGSDHFPVAISLKK